MAARLEHGVLTVDRCARRAEAHKPRRIPIS
ncbi:MAG: hypothetical protein R3F43_17060 [bacterium]